MSDREKKNGYISSYVHIYTASAFVLVCFTFSSSGLCTGDPDPAPSRSVLPLTHTSLITWKTQETFLFTRNEDGQVVPQQGFLGRRNVGYVWEDSLDPENPEKPPHTAAIYTSLGNVGHMYGLSHPFMELNGSQGSEGNAGHAAEIIHTCMVEGWGWACLLHPTTSAGSGRGAGPLLDLAVSEEKMLNESVQVA